MQIGKKLGTIGLKYNQELHLTKKQINLLFSSLSRIYGQNRNFNLSKEEYVRQFLRIVPILIFYQKIQLSTRRKEERFIFLSNLIQDLHLSGKDSFLKIPLLISEIENLDTIRRANDKFEFNEVNILDFLEEVVPPYLDIFPLDKSLKQGTVFTPAKIISGIFTFIDKISFDVFSIEEIFQKSDLFDPAAGAGNFEIGLINFLLEKGLSKKKIINLIESNLMAGELNLSNYFLGKSLLFQILKDNDQIETSKLFRLDNIKHLNSLKRKDLRNFKYLTKDPEKSKPLIIFGNPPYSVSSFNKNTWINDLLDAYAVPEPNLTRLYDDYVKFIRVSQWLLKDRKNGIIAFITNRKFLDGKIYYGMRKSLLRTFNTIFIMDLHGDARNRKKSRRNENVFGIQTGICITFLIKTSKLTVPSDQGVFYCSISGTKKKIEETIQSQIEKRNFQLIFPQPPKYLFTVLNIPHKYRKMWKKAGVSLPECFDKSNRAMITSRDRFMINPVKTELKKNLKLLENRQFETLRKNKRLKKSFDKILENDTILNTFNIKKMQNSIQLTNYRPFDYQYVINYTINRRCGTSAILNHLSQSPQKEKQPPEKYNFQNGSLSPSVIETILNDPVLAQGIGFNFVQSVQSPPFRHIFITEGIVDSGLFGYSTSKVAPLWIGNKPNISQIIIQKFQSEIKKYSIGKILGYFYGLLHAPYYAETFQEFLLHHYPKVFQPTNYSLFHKIANKGLTLIGLHLLWLSPEKRGNLKNQIPEKFKKNSYFLKKWIFNQKEEQLHLRFKNPSLKNKSFSVKILCKCSTWEYHIGSIQIIKHWLKYRKLRQHNPFLWSKKEFLQLLIINYVIQQTRYIYTELDPLVRDLMNNLTQNGS